MRSDQAGRLGGWSTAFLLTGTVAIVGLIGFALRSGPSAPPDISTPLPLSASVSPAGDDSSPTAITPPDPPAPVTRHPLTLGTPAPAARHPIPLAVPLAVPPAGPMPGPTSGPSPHPNSANLAGIAAYEAGRYQDAVTAFEQALADQPDQPVIRHNIAAATAALGWAAVEAREADDAIRQFRRAIEFDRTEASFYAGLSLAYQFRREPQRAIDALRAAVALAPDQTELYEQLADLLYQRNQLDDAIAVLTMGVEQAGQPDRLSASLARLTREQSLQAQFLQTGTRHFTMQFDGGENRATAYQVLDLLELAYRDVGQAFAHFPDEDITVILYNNEQFRDITQTPGWTKGVYDGKIRLPVGGAAPDRSLLAKVVYHEYTHAVVHELAGGRTPTWLNEGLAVYVEGFTSGNPDAARTARRPADRLAPAALLPLTALHGSFLSYSAEQAAVAYAESADAVRFLIDRYGLHRVKELLLLLAVNRPFDRAFETIFFVTYPEFERLWLETLPS